MIINIRGTNGSGKSTVVRQVMNSCNTVVQIAYPQMEHRRKPMGYICTHGNQKLFIPGHYEIANGGIDTLPSLNYAHDLILQHYEYGADVLYEGKNFTENIERILLLHKAGIDVRVIFIEFPIDDCIAAVRARGHQIKEETIIALYKKCQKEFALLRKTEVKCLKLNRSTIHNVIIHWLWGGSDASLASAERLSGASQHT